MASPRFTEKEFYGVALSNFDTGGRPLDYTEFKQEANRIIYIPKYLKKLKSEQPDKREVRLMLNYAMIAFNSFNGRTLSLLYTVADEAVYPELNAMLLFLGKYPKDGTVHTIYNTPVDLDLYNVENGFLSTLQEGI